MGYVDSDSYGPASSLNDKINNVGLLDFLYKFDNTYSTEHTKKFNAKY